MPKSKSILLVTLAAILLLALSACGGEPAPANSAPDAENLPAADNSPDTEPAPEQPDNQAESDGEEAEQETPTEEPAPTGTPAEEETAAVSYANDVFPIIDSRCATCHGVDRIEGELILLSYEEMMAGGESGPVIVPRDAENSYLAEMISTQKMPKRGPKLTPVQTQTILDWIIQGALDN